VKLIDLDQCVIVPVVDESRGGMRYEMQMSVGELLKGTLEDFEPAVVDAVPVEWLKAQIRSYTGDVSDIGKSARNGTIKDLIRKWQKEQEAKRNG
jgi:muramidase (phage lysozyme)